MQGVALADVKRIRIDWISGDPSDTYALELFKADGSSIGNFPFASNFEHDPDDPVIYDITAEDITSDPSLVVASMTTSESHAIPTVSEWGLVVITLLGLATGTILYGRRRTQRWAA
ncbi:MAG: hypothetical protein IH987_20860 [Planctomycetes bacterium]|nr:hypothetical protein [Planctomycetota bacterium]